ncbi:MAG: D-arabinono-1,4-lactone oxidase [Kofleriaceae bacterium]
MPTIRNFGGNVRFRPRQVARPRDRAEVAAVVRSAARVRAVGAAHSWSPAIVTDDTLVTLARMRAPLALDRERMQVTVQAGMTLHALNAYLAGHGLALASLGSIAEQTVAGAIATGTHGSGARFGCLSTLVAALELVDGAGRVVPLARGEPDFDAAVVGLGALGIVTAVTLDVVPAFQLHDRTGRADFDAAVAGLPAALAASDHYKLWWLPPGDDVIVYDRRRTQAPANDRPMRRWWKDRVVSVAVYRSLVAAGQASGRRWIPGINRFLTREAGRALDRVVPSPIGFLTPVPPVHREAEWAFPAADAARLLPAYRAALLAGGHTYNFIQEIRWSAADDLWLSPGYQRATVWLSLYNIDRRRWPAQLEQFEAFARAHDGRPHWGKEARFDRAYLRRQYPRLDDFAALTARYDPGRKFRNPWLDAILDG